MVLAERNPELVRNGRRSRGPSPNGHGGGNSGGGPGGVTVGGGGGGGGGTVTPETSSDDDNSIKRNGKAKNKQSEYEEKIRVGRDYQAVCPPLVPEPERKPEILNDRALLVWSPTRDIPDIKLEEYISVAKEKYGYNGEQALGMLFWHKHDLERAVMDLANFTPFPDEWTVEDKVLFEQAFQFHGKSFHRIRQMLPDKSIASLVKYYYSWKKTRHRQSVMDRQEKAKASKEGSENGSENGSNEESDSEDKEQALASSASGLQDQSNSKLSSSSADLSSSKQISKVNAASGEHAAAADAADSESTNASANAVITAGKQPLPRQQTPPISNNDSSCTAVGVGGLAGAAGGGGGGGSGGGRTTPTNGGSGGCCANCGVACNILNASPHGKLCSSCHHHWRRTGNKRPTSGPYFGKRSRDRNAERHKRKPPRGMYINHDDIVALASANDNQDELLANTDREIVSLLSQVQLNKQNISALKRKNSDNLEDLRPAENVNRISSRWTNDELLLAVQGVQKFGKDFQTIAETIGTKTEAHVRTFYVNYRRRYNLDQVLKKHEAEKEAAATAAGGTAAAVTSPAGAAASTETASTTNKKEDLTKKKDSIAAGVATAGTTTTTTPNAATVTTTAADESDNTTSSETTASKSTNNDEAKSSSSSSTVTTATQKDNIVMEIDLDAEQADTPPPPAKKIALAAANQDFPKASAV